MKWCGVYDRLILYVAENVVHCPKDLEDLYELYNKEREDWTRNGLGSRIDSPLPSISREVCWRLTLEA